ncbi:hypothetical protein EVAR_86420_1 [Eumeta japonica]|uniref:Uncharacterized protein n=1 Tax=Eumeta variegata TaxID=151549 RepID=A0A4C1ZBB8_EUMVA|nr:hypothetical protein EVAR_86420_1 [Eumeta japonica]
MEREPIFPHETAAVCSVPIADEPTQSSIRGEVARTKVRVYRSGVRNKRVQRNTERDRERQKSERGARPPRPADPDKFRPRTRVLDHLQPTMTRDANQVVGLSSSRLTVQRCGIQIAILEPFFAVDYRFYQRHGPPISTSTYQFCELCRLTTFTGSVKLRNRKRKDCERPLQKDDMTASCRDVAMGGDNHLF